jgi:hypothetical protein
MSDTNPALIRLVASRYSEMKGLRTVGDASWLLAGAALLSLGAWADAVDSLPIPGLVVAILVFAAYSGLWMGIWRNRVERYYDERFGRVGPRTIVPVSWVIVPSVGLGWATIFLDLHAPLPLTIATVTIFVGIWPAWIAARDFPYRGHWGLVAIAAIVAALLLPAEASLRFAWRTDAMLEVGGAMVMAGLCDHLLLMRTLSHTARPASEDAR